MDISKFQEQSFSWLVLALIVSELSGKREASECAAMLGLELEGWVQLRRAVIEAHPEDIGPCVCDLCGNLFDPIANPGSGYAALIDAADPATHIQWRAARGIKEVCARCILSCASLAQVIKEADAIDKPALCVAHLTRPTQ